MGRETGDRAAVLHGRLGQTVMVLVLAAAAGASAWALAGTAACGREAEPPAAASCPATRPEAKDQRLEERRRHLGEIRRISKAFEQYADTEMGWPGGRRVIIHEFVRPDPAETQPATEAGGVPVPPEGILEPLTAEAREAIAGLIRQLGDPSYDLREAATRKLADIGVPALPALRAAAEGDDPEIRMRAGKLCEAITRPPLARLRMYRAQVEAAFLAGEYLTAARLAAWVVATEDAALHDWLWLGHACQLTGRWEQAVSAYQKVIECLGKGETLEEADRRKGKERGLRRPLNEYSTGTAAHLQAGAGLWIARMQLLELKDRQAAIATLIKAIETHRAGKTKYEPLAKELEAELKRARGEPATRPARKPPAAPAGPARVILWAAQRGGTFTLNGEPYQPRPPRRPELAPGKYLLRYQVPGRADAFAADFVAEPGGDYKIFVNLDSPFAFSQVLPGSVLCQSVTRLPDGRYLAAGAAEQGPEIMLAASKNLTHWGRPYRAAFNSVFRNVCPTVFTDASGTIWLAYFSGRLSVMSLHGKFRLFLTSSRDGRTWTLPRMIHVRFIDAWPDRPAQIWRGPRGRYWMFWNEHFASVESLADLRRLEKMTMPRLGRTRWNWRPFRPYVTCDGRGRFHMLFEGTSRGLYHTSSVDGKSWQVPTELVARNAEHARLLLLADGRGVLVYCRTDGTYVASLSLTADPPRLGPGRKIAPSLSWTWQRLSVLATEDGRVCVFPPGYMLHAKLADLVKALKPAPE